MVNVEEHLGLARKIAWEYSKNNIIEFDDAFQIACEGLVVASQRFDESKGFTFSTYAMWFATGYLKRHLREKSTMIKTPRSVLDLHKQVVELYENGNSFETISKKLKKPLCEIFKSYKAYEPLTSLDFEVNDKDSTKIPLSSFIKSEEDLEDVVVNKAFIQALLNRLNKMEKEVLNYRYFIGLTQYEIAKKLNISQVKVSRTERRALKKLRDFSGVDRRVHI